jgi:hypothetical protein
VSEIKRIEPVRERVRYELKHDQLEEVYEIRRVELVGVFEAREAARQHMIDTEAERKARDACTHDAFANVVRAARAVTEHFAPDQPWRFDGKRLSDEAADALLSLHDYLNDVERERAAVEGDRHA